MKKAVALGPCCSTHLFCPAPAWTIVKPPSWRKRKSCLLSKVGYTGLVSMEVMERDDSKRIRVHFPQHGPLQGRHQSLRAPTGSKSDRSGKSEVKSLPVHFSHPPNNRSRSLVLILPARVHHHIVCVHVPASVATRIRVQGAIYNSITIYLLRTITTMILFNLCTVVVHLCSSMDLGL